MTTCWAIGSNNVVVRDFKSLKNIKSVYVTKQSDTIKDGKFSEYRVTVKITFKVA
jgi:flavin-binding protein dodecin